MKRFLKLLPCIALAVLLACIALHPTEAQAASVEDLTFTITDGEVTITGFKEEKPGGELVIPETIDGYPVTTIGNSAFDCCGRLTSVTIPNGVIRIGHTAFGDCCNLTSVTIPDSVTTIDSCAFWGCTSLTSVTIPDSVTSLGVNAFAYCTSLSGIWVNENNPYYSSDSRGVLFNKQKTKLLMAPGTIISYSIPNGVIRIEVGAFYGSQNLTSVTIPAGVTTIGGGAFYCCQNLTSVTIPASVTSVEDSAFSGCHGLRGVYYTGTQAQWDAIDFNLDNGPLHRTPNFVSPCADGHTEEIIPGKAATCTETGLTAGVKCAVCGEILTAQEKIPTTGHTFGEDATCDTCGYTKLTADAISLDATNKLVVTDGEAANINHRAVVYFLGDATVEDITDEAALKALDPNAKTHWGLTAINKRQLLENGNYVIHLHYNEGTGAKQTVAKAFTVAVTKPTLAVNGHKVVATAGSDACVNYRATVYNLGDGSVGDITDEAALQNAAVEVKTLWGLERINKLQLLKNGNYVILLHYNVGNSAKQTIANEVTIDLGQITLEVNDGKLVAEDPANSYSSHRAVVYYLGDETVENIYDEAALKAIDGEAKTYWQMIRINNVKLTQPGNYVVLLHYNLEGSAKLTLAVQVTI